MITIMIITILCWCNRNVLHPEMISVITLMLGDCIDGDDHIVHWNESLGYIENWEQAFFHLKHQSKFMWKVSRAAASDNELAFFSV